MSFHWREPYAVVFLVLLWWKFTCVVSMLQLGKTTAFLPRKVFHRSAPFRIQSSRSRRFDNLVPTSGYFTEDAYLKHLQSPNSKLSPYWIHQLSLLDRPIAKSLISQLIPDNVLGYDDGKGDKNEKSTKALSFLGFTLQQKQKHSDKIILMRSGEFYETYGVDALMLINHAGLNPMGGKCKAGCPVKNVQQTLDSLTAQGLSVAVYEEIADFSATVSATSSVKMKKRALTQVVSPASRTYIYDLCLRSDDIDFQENCPAVGISRNAQGFTLVQIHLDERRVTVQERLTAEGVSVTLSARGAIDPIFAHNVDTATLNQLFLYNRHHEVVRIEGVSDVTFPRHVLQRVGHLLEMDTQTFRFSNQVYQVEKGTDSGDTGVARKRVSQVNTNDEVDDKYIDHKYNIINSNNDHVDEVFHYPYHYGSRPRPIYTSTALQIGLLPNDNVPCLVPQLLPRTHSALAFHFWRQWLLHPPPRHIATQMQNLCRALSETQCPLPPFQAISVGKIVTLLAAKQCNVALFRDILNNIQCFLTLCESHPAFCDTHNSNISNNNDKISMRQTQETKRLLDALLPITAFVSGVSIDLRQLRRDCKVVRHTIASVIYDPYNNNNINSAHNNCHFDNERDCDSSLDTLCVTTPETQERISYTEIPEHLRIPEDFIKRNEDSFRQKVKRSHPAVAQLYKSLEEAAVNLQEVLLRDVPHDGSVEIVHDMMENALLLRDKTIAVSRRKKSDDNDNSINNSNNNKVDENVAEKRKRFTSYVDRKGKTSQKRHTTPSLKDALDRYLTISETGPAVIAKILQDLSATLCDTHTHHHHQNNNPKNSQHQGSNMVSIVQTGHLAVTLQATLQHTVAARQKDWHLPTLIDLPESPEAYDTSNDTLDHRNNNTINMINNNNNNFASDTSEGTLSRNIHTRHPFSLHLPGLTPYWLSRDTSARHNDVDLFRFFLLTAPNMSGKSTLLRSLLSAALLATCGLFIPARDTAKVPRFDHFFLRTASYDVPSEAKSAFALEMDDLRVILRDATHKSLVLIDEMGKGTSAKDGAALAGALLEHLMNDKQCFGVFATHLHEMFQLPLKFHAPTRLMEKTMGFTYVGADDGPLDTVNSHNSDKKHYGINDKKVAAARSVQWTYQLCDGRCEDSMALVTARQFHIDHSILQRATQLQHDFDRMCRATRHPSTQDNNFDNATATQGNTPADTSQSSTNNSAISSLHTTGMSKERDTNPHFLRDVLLPALSTSFDISSNHNFIYIPADFMPPPSLEGTACVYILHIYLPNKPDVRGVFYVGETESLTQRLRQHRLFYRKTNLNSIDNNNNNGCVVSCVAISVPHKSAARRLETRLIQHLKTLTFPNNDKDNNGNDDSNNVLIFERDADARHSLFSRMT